jgi:hypothetical protein
MKIPNISMAYSVQRTNANPASSDTVIWGAAFDAFLNEIRCTNCINFAGCTYIFNLCGEEEIFFYCCSMCRCLTAAASRPMQAVGEACPYAGTWRPLPSRLCKICSWYCCTYKGGGGFCAPLSRNPKQTISQLIPELIQQRRLGICLLVFLCLLPKVTV